MNRRAGRLVEAQFLARVRRVGNQLADEDFFVRVKRMDDDVQQLLNLRLEMMGLFFAHRGCFLIKVNALVKRPAGAAAVDFFTSPAGLNGKVRVLNYLVVMINCRPSVSC